MNPSGVFGLVRQTPPAQLLFGVLFHASPILASCWWAMVTLRALLPVGFLVGTGAVVTAVADGGQLTGPLVLMGSAFVLQQTLAPVHHEVGALLGAKAGELLHDRLVRATLGAPGVAHLERSDHAEDLALAKDFDLGMTGPTLAECIAYLGTAFAQFGGGLVTVLVLFGYHWWVAVLVVLAWLSPQVLLRDSTRWRDWHSDETKEHQRHAEYAYRVAVEPTNAKEVRVFGMAPWLLDGFARHRRRLLEMSLEAIRLKERSLGWTLALMLVIDGTVFALLAMDAYSGVISLGDMIVYTGAVLGAAVLGSLEFGWWLDTASRPVPVVSDLEARFAASGALHGGAVSAAGMPSHGVHFHNVSFSYPGAGSPALDGLTLEIPAGSSVAIVGRNGAGKTTLAKLICRLYDPEHGAIEVDGVDLRSLDLTSWRERVAAVFQDFVRYQLPLRDNVSLHVSSDVDVEEALRAVDADDLAALDIVLHRAYENGTDLSGGQWQRVAVARALHAVASGAGVVLLDEPTAQLDVRGETEVFDRILEATRGRTTVLVSHRFSTVRRVDKIVVVEHGKVVEQGTHDELMALGGRYRTMFDLQAARFAEDLTVGGPHDPVEEADRVEA